MNELTEEVAERGQGNSKVKAEVRGSTSKDIPAIFEHVRRYFGLLALPEAQRLEFSKSHPTAYTAEQYRVLWQMTALK